MKHLRSLLAVLIVGALLTLSGCTTIPGASMALPADALGSWRNVTGHTRTTITLMQGGKGTIDATDSRPLLAGATPIAPIRYVIDGDTITFTIEEYSEMFGLRRGERQSARIVQKTKGLLFASLELEFSHPNSMMNSGVWRSR